jgi:murein DD-endopeptidase MepM/ murein hydrolase activator NlpD
VAPVDAAVVDPFRPPAGPYGPGNRGLEYGTELGQAVVAVADGTVRFAAPVGGAPVVVIDHGGGLVSTYVRLLEGSVARADRVVAGTPVAVADVGFHLTARLDGRYIDPAALLDRPCIGVRLVVPPVSGRR